MKISKQTDKELMSLIHLLCTLTLNQVKEIYLRYATETLGRGPDDDMPDKFYSESEAEAVYILNHFDNAHRRVIHKQISHDEAAWQLYSSIDVLLETLRNMFYPAIAAWLTAHGGNPTAHEEYSLEFRQWADKFGEEIFQHCLQGEEQKPFDITSLCEQPA